MTEHEHEFVQYRDHRPPRCKCGAWLQRIEEIVTDRPCPPPGEGKVIRRPSGLLMRLRQGRRVPVHLYEQLGPEPADTDPPVGTALTAELAERIVAAVNRDEAP
jgi:hypothetical protein